MDTLSTPSRSASHKPSRMPAAITIVGAALLFLGSMMPWLILDFVTFTRTMSPLELGGDAKIFLASAVISFCIGVASLNSATPALLQRSVAVLAALTLILIAIDSANPTEWGVSTPDTAAVGASYGPGLYMMATGAVVMLFGALTVRSPNPEQIPRPGLTIAAVGCALVGVLILWSAVLYTPATLFGLLALLLGMETLIGSWGGSRTMKRLTVWALATAAIVVGVGTVALTVRPLYEAKHGTYWTDSLGEKHRYWIDEHGFKWE